MSRITPPRRIADIHDTHVSGNEIVKTFQRLWRESDGNGPASASRRRTGETGAGSRAGFATALQCAAGCAIRAFTAPISASIRARIATFEPTSASDDAMIR